MKKISKKLPKDPIRTIVEDVSVFEQFNDEKNFSLLFYINKRKHQKKQIPGMRLDRLHTYVIKYVQEIV